ncbi:MULTISPECIES: ParB/RepB/Spo0J family partition protein [Streptomyces]|uniref:ParB/RepB/Spo0J family partition protein n=1 Tax=Streptomyces TaxID=1883 RepID=UPI00224C9BD2|nr:MULTISPECIES: ParB/RepB/Spo0J family partition protein [unclassified Streptomyces]WTB60814.1 ParB/RepB/Spo0J family partition protein [Streptomyces sp. NBC_00826]WTH95955.1 ParB/RepB/Spo0J family partition protein [Streptomyces sp. NBC_00825]WTI05021.1 ParB/RepB/Spo0J family partition protein [Streptomyces sp. NBC_00822]MCX4870326.1 ParB/RepB/Spo0J family partition protein [Streptomyces sp. NBC_00906]MCX4902197.1 ParB/RepB/Spo0J family partition protein [Streptomyces sp. NBC_00892]
MSKAKNLGAGSSFAQARPISARRAAIGAATGVPTAGVPDPTELALNLISQNPDNPREELRDLEGLAESIAEIGLVNAVTVASIEAYLEERPHRAADLDEGARYIVVDGHRRLAAARLAGAAKIRVSVDNALVSTDEALLEAAFVANVHRDDMNPLEQAQALRTLVDFYGSQTKAAKRLGIAQSTISSKLSVLDLDPQLQADLVEGRRKIEHVRNLSKLPPDEQRQQADARAAAGVQRRSAVRELSRRDSSESGDADESGGGADTSDGLAVPGSSEGQRAEVSRRDNPGEASAGLSRRDSSGESQADLSRRDSPSEEQADLSRRDNPGAREAELSRRDSSEAREEVSATHDEVPGQRSEHAGRQVAPAQLAPGESGIVALGKVTKMPWHDGHQVADLVLRKMDEAQRKILVDRILAEGTNSVR